MFADRRFIRISWKIDNRGKINLVGRLNFENEVENHVTSVDVYDDDERCGCGGGADIVATLPCISKGESVDHHE